MDLKCPYCGSQEIIMEFEDELICGNCDTFLLKYVNGEFITNMPKLLEIIEVKV